MAELKKAYGPLDDSEDEIKIKPEHVTHSKCFYIIIIFAALASKSLQPMAIAAAKNDAGNYDFDV